jgi:DNA-binding Xre family transcriptional regulator
LAGIIFVIAQIFKKGVEIQTEKTGNAKAIRFSTLEAICKALDCQPADILEYTE